jgi:hypothetical protein
LLYFGQPIQKSTSLLIYTHYIKTSNTSPRACYAAGIRRNSLKKKIASSWLPKRWEMKEVATNGIVYIVSTRQTSMSRLVFW